MHTGRPLLTLHRLSVVLSLRMSFAHRPLLCGNANNRYPFMLRGGFGDHHRVMSPIWGRPCVITEDGPGGRQLHGPVRLLPDDSVLLLCH